MRTLCLLSIALAAATAHAEPETISEGAGLLAELHFGEGSTRLPETAGSQLFRVAVWAEKHYDGLVVLDGHADWRGANAHNMRLSLRRARIVRDQLIALGVDPNQIIISAFNSEERPRARVAVWGTRESLESVIADRGTARVMMWRDVYMREQALQCRR